MARAFFRWEVVKWYEIEKISPLDKTNEIIFSLPEGKEVKLSLQPLSEPDRQELATVLRETLSGKEEVKVG